MPAKGDYNRDVPFVESRIAKVRQNCTRDRMTKNGQSGPETVHQGHRSEQFGPLRATHDQRSPQVPVSQDGIFGRRVQDLDDLVPDRTEVAHLLSHCESIRGRDQSRGLGAFRVEREA